MGKITDGKEMFVEVRMEAARDSDHGKCGADGSGKNQERDSIAVTGLSRQTARNTSRGTYMSKLLVAAMCPAQNMRPDLFFTLWRVH